VPYSDLESRLNFCRVISRYSRQNHNSQKRRRRRKKNECRVASVEPLSIRDATRSTSVAAAAIVVVVLVVVVVVIVIEEDEDIIMMNYRSIE